MKTRKNILSMTGLTVMLLFSASEQIKACTTDAGLEVIPAQYYQGTLIVPAQVYAWTMTDGPTCYAYIYTINTREIRTTPSYMSHNESDSPSFPSGDAYANVTYVSSTSLGMQCIESEHRFDIANAGPLIDEKGPECVTGY